MLRAAALLLALFSAPALQAEGGGRAGLLSGIDRVLADPSDEAAKKELAAASAAAAATEKAAADAERQRLQAGADADYARLTDMRAEKAARVREWTKRFDRACELARGAATSKRAVDEYERLLAVFPVYTDSADLLRDSGVKIMSIFYETVKRDYPYLAAGRAAADSKMLASLQFARNSEQMSERGGGVNSGVADAEVRRADRLERTRRKVLDRLDDMSAGLTLVRRRRWDEALKYFEAVLAWDKGNEEALYYAKLARSRAKEKR